MDLLHLVPHALLLCVAAWLIWPAIIDPIRARLAVRFHPDAPTPDGVAEALFTTWGDDAKQSGANRRIA